MLKWRSLAVFGRVNDLRYQPVPEIGNAPVWGLILGSNGPSMAQSCGKRISLHCASWKSGRSAPAASPLKKRQLSLKLTRRSPESWTAVAAAARAEIADRDNKAQRPAVENRLVLLIHAPYKRFEPYSSGILPGRDRGGGAGCLAASQPKLTGGKTAGAT